jgi:hypothetical protein
MLESLPPGAVPRDWSQPLPYAQDPFANPVVAPPICLDAEQCDEQLMAWRDGVWVGESAYGEEEFRLGSQDPSWMNEIFYRPGEDDSIPQSDIRLHTAVVRIRINVAGVPIEIDGVRAGFAPTIVEVMPGRHTIKLYGGEDQYSVFEVVADSDPDQWCFSASGRQFRRAMCN